MADNKQIVKAEFTPGDEKPVFTWKTSEFTQYSKDSSWFLIIAVAAVALIAFFVWQKNWTAVGVVAAGAAALFAQSRIRPKTIICSLYRGGFVINEKPHRYDEFKSFWFIPAEHPKIRFEPIARLSSYVNMPIAEEDPEQIRLFIAKFLPEDENKGEDIADVIQRWTRF